MKPCVNLNNYSFLLMLTPLFIKAYSQQTAFAFVKIVHIGTHLLQPTQFKRMAFCLPYKHISTKSKSWNNSVAEIIQENYQLLLPLSAFMFLRSLSSLSYYSTMIPLFHIKQVFRHLIFISLSITASARILISRVLNGLEAGKEVDVGYRLGASLPCISVTLDEARRFPRGQTRRLVLGLINGHHFRSGCRCLVSVVYTHMPLPLTS